MGKVLEGDVTLAHLNCSEFGTKFEMHVALCWPKFPPDSFTLRKGTRIDCGSLPHSDAPRNATDGADMVDNGCLKL